MTGLGHGHGQPRTATGQHRRALLTVMVLSGLIAVAEVTGAVITGSLVLLADAAHMAADVFGIGLSLLAAHFAARPPTSRRTFGYARAEILAGTEAQHGMQLLNQKYAPWKQLLDFFAMFRKRERTVFVIRAN